MRCEEISKGISFTKVDKIIRPGRQVAQSFQGGLSSQFISEVLRKSKMEPETVIKRLESIFQSERTLQEVLVPRIPEFFELISNETPIPYKGVSYNPFVTTFGENVNLLDFFSWIRRSGMRGVILDASLYAVVNASKEQLSTRYSSKSAAEAVAFLKEGIGRFPNIRLAAEMRERYLRAAAVSLFSPRDAPLVISAEEFWDNRKEYLECLQEAIRFCAGNPKDGEPLKIERFAEYERYGAPYQRWYSVLVLAEVLYLNRVYGVNIKLGPTSEAAFDTLIRDIMREQGIRFGFVWYDREIEKDIPYPQRLFFDDSPETIAEKLRDDLLWQWIKEIASPFIRGDRPLPEEVFALISRVRDCASRPLPRLDAEGEWFMTFPPGECD